MKNNNNVKAILLDLDGTLADSLPCLHRIVNQILQTNQLPLITLEQLRGYVDCGSDTIIHNSLPPRTDHLDAKELQRFLLDTYIDCLAEQTAFFQPLPQCLDQLTQQGIPWGIVTNRPGAMTTPLIESHAFLQQAGCIVCSDTIGIAKPNPEPLLHACQQLGCPPQATLYIGDTDNDMLAAQRALMPSIFVEYGYRRQEQHNTPVNAHTVIATPELLATYLQGVFSLSAPAL